MNPTPPSSSRRSSRLPFRSVGALAAVLLALLPGAAFAQEAWTEDRNEVILLTSVIVVLSLALCAVGYLYRRARGMDHPTPDEIEMMGGHGHGGDDHHDLAVPPHPEAEHGTPAPAAAGTSGHGHYMRDSGSNSGRNVMWPAASAWGGR